MRTAARQAGLALAEAALAFATLWVFLEGWRRDFRVPVYFSHDALEYLMQVKGTIENGWWWIHPRLSAPGTFVQVLYPSNPSIDQAIVWLVQIGSDAAGLVINLSWMIMVALSATIAGHCLRLLGISLPISVAAGLLFALSPYALYRNIDHFSLAIYLVPVPCTIALLLSSGRFGDITRGERGLLMGGCALVGFNYPYYAFFGCFIILAAALIGVSINGWRQGLRHGLACIGIICVATALNLAPSLFARAQYGKPASIVQKVPAESEQYGLKVRQLISPVLHSSFQPFSRWIALEEEARFPLETENTGSRLGVLAAIGFLMLLGALLVPDLAGMASDRVLFLTTGRLTLALLLLATVGGFGSLFSLLVSPDIRAYNRVTPFISFFALLALALASDKWLRYFTHRRARQVAAAALTAVLIAGLVDLRGAAFPLNRDYYWWRLEWVGIQKLVDVLEQRLPDGAMVFQMPVLTYLAETGRERMRPHDHVKPYLASRHLHWSYPALSDDIVRWQQQVARLSPPDLVQALNLHGFRALLIDRNGYADRGAGLLSGLGFRLVRRPSSWRTNGTSPSIYTC
jgi:phosphoglycerol transferase